MPFTDAAKNVMLAAIASGTAPALRITHVAAHSAYPPTTGNQLGSRVAIAYNAPSAGVIDDSTNGAAIAIPTASTVASVGYWSASTAGTLLAQEDVVDEVFAGAGTYNVTDSDLSITD